MHILSEERNTSKMVSEFHQLEAALSARLRATGPINRFDLVAIVSVEEGAEPDEVRLTLKRMSIVEDRVTRTIRLAG